MSRKLSRLAGLGFYAVVLLFLWPTGYASAAEKVTVAILGAETSEPARGFLMTELSQLPDVAVVERAELDKFVAEHSLARANLTGNNLTRIGRILHADVLIFLNIDPAKSGGSLRLVSTAAGVDLHGESFKTPRSTESEWAHMTALKLTPYLRSFGAPAKERIPLSILKIRSVIGGLEATRQEHALGFLLVRRLMNEPSLAVLERTDMGQLEWENSLRANPSTYLTGTYLLDGSLTPDSQGLSVSARLRAPNSAEPITIDAKGSNTAQLAENLATQVVAALKVKQPAKAWDPAAEAQQYQQEAQWAYRWHLYQECSQAAESAWALGARNDTLALLRCASQAEFIKWSPLTGGPQKPPAFRLGDVVLLCDYPAESLAWKGGDLSKPWVGTGAYCLGIGSDILRSFYYSYPLAPNEEVAVKVIRGRMRALCETLKTAEQRLTPPKPGNTGPEAELEKMFPQGHLIKVRGTSESLWQETAEEGVEKVVQVFADFDRLDPRTRWAMEQDMLIRRGDGVPWIAYWRKGDCSKVPFAVLRKRLLAMPSAERQIDVGLMMLGPRENVDPTSAGGEDSQHRAAAKKDLERILLNAVPAMARGEIFPRRVEDALQELAKSNFGDQDANRIAAESKAFTLSLVKLLLRDPACTYDILSAITPDDTRLTREETQELLKLAKAAPGDKALYITTLNRYLTPLKQTWAEAPIPVTNQALKPFLTVSTKDIIGDGQVNIGGVRQIGDQLWLYGRDMSATAAAHPIALFHYDLKNRSAARIPVPPSGEFLVDLALIHDQIFASNQHVVMQFSPGENRWKELTLSEMTYPKIWAIDGLLYGAGDPGLIFRYNPANGKSEVLASSRRRPAATILDDVAPYDVSKIFKDYTGRICAVIGVERIVRWDESKRVWDEVFDAAKLKGPEGVDRNLILSEIGPESLRPGPTAPIHPAHPTNFLVMSSSGARGRSPGPPNFPPAPGIPGMPGAPGFPESRITPGSFLGSAFDGTNLWWVTIAGTGNKALLKSLSIKDGAKTTRLLDIPYQFTTPQGQWLNATPDGLTFFDRETAYLFRKGEIFGR